MKANNFALNVMLRKGLHLVLSYYALADRENMRKSFMRLLDVNLETDDLDRLFPNEVESHLIGNHLNNCLKFVTGKRAG
jgi:hypothetical protein